MKTKSNTSPSSAQHCDRDDEDEMPPLPNKKLHELHEMHEFYVDLYGKMFADVERKAALLDHQIDDFIVLLEETAKARELAWGNDGGADEIASMIVSASLEYRLKLLERLICEARK